MKSFAWILDPVQLFIYIIYKNNLFGKSEILLCNEREKEGIENVDIFFQNKTSTMSVGKRLYDDSFCY